MNTFRALLRKRVVLTVFAVAMVSTPAIADEAADVNALLQSRQFAAALAKADAFLKKNPRDPQMRFLKGLTLTSMDRQPEAVAVFTALTADHPNLAEPYNNLAVIHAADRQFDSARTALEKAIQADPNYTTAYENLADLYVQLANQTYSKVLQIDPGNTTAKLRQSLLRKVNEQAADNVPPAADRKVTLRSDEPEKEIVLSVVKDWARAWSARDVAAYLSFYGPEFRAPQQDSRPAWEKKRRALIEGKSRIDVGIKSPQVSIDDRLATVRFRQKYVSGNHSSTEPKTLVLRKYDDRWKIVEERRGS